MLAPTVPQEVGGPILLKEVRDLGELHTVANHYSRVFSFESSKEVEGWASNIPMARQVVNAATRNKVLVTAEGEVEAGIDLSKAEISPNVNGWTVTLPDPKVYDPNVELTVHGQKDGLFWRDLNVVNKARTKAGNDMVQAGIDNGILVKAKENAVSQVSNLLKGMTEKEIKVVFKGEID